MNYCYGISSFKSLDLMYVCGLGLSRLISEVMNLEGVHRI